MGGGASIMWLCLSKTVFAPYKHFYSTFTHSTVEYLSWHLKNFKINGLFKWWIQNHRQTLVDKIIEGPLSPWPLKSGIGGVRKCHHGTAMNFDDILIRLGEFGRYQKILYFLAVCLPGISCGVFMVISVFLMGVPEHRSDLLLFTFIYLYIFHWLTLIIYRYITVSLRIENFLR